MIASTHILGPIFQIFVSGYSRDTVTSLRVFSPLQRRAFYLPTDTRSLGHLEVGEHSGYETTILF